MGAQLAASSPTAGFIACQNSEKLVPDPCTSERRSAIRLGDPLGRGAFFTKKVALSEVSPEECFSYTACTAIGTSIGLMVRQRLSTLWNVVRSLDPQLDSLGRHLLWPSQGTGDRAQRCAGALDQPTVDKHAWAWASAVLVGAGIAYPGEAAGF